MIYGFGCGGRRLAPAMRWVGWSIMDRLGDYPPLRGCSPGRVRTCGRAILRRQVTFIAAAPSTRPLRTTTRSRPDQP